MRAAYDEYQNQGFEVLSISIQEDDTAVRDFIGRHALTYPFLMDRTGQVSGTYEITTTPTTYFIAPDGTIADMLAGTVNQAWLESNIDDYLST